MPIRHHTFCFLPSLLDRVNIKSARGRRCQVILCLPPLSKLRDFCSCEQCWYEAQTDNIMCIICYGASKDLINITIRDHSKPCSYWFCVYVIQYNLILDFLLSDRTSGLWISSQSRFSLGVWWGTQVIVRPQEPHSWYKSVYYLAIYMT